MIEVLDIPDINELSDDFDMSYGFNLIELQSLYNLCGVDRFLNCFLSSNIYLYYILYIKYVFCKLL